MDQVDAKLVRALQADATQSFADLARTVNLSPAATHERVRKLRDRGTIVRTTVEVNPDAVGRGVLAFVMLSSDAWVGDASTRDRLAAIDQVEAAFVIAGEASLLIKVRTSSHAELQQVLRNLHNLEGVTSTRSTVVLETFFERPFSLPTVP